MVTSGVVRNALDLNKEDAKTRERYKGVEQFLTARRLVEAGRRLRHAVDRRLGHARPELHRR